MASVLGLLGWWLSRSHWSGRPAAGRATAADADAAPTHPNILFVVYDARRRDDFSFGRQGNRRGDTSALAALKDNAAYFENAIAPGVWTVPVHASMFTGRSVCDLGIDYYNPGHLMLSRNAPTLAEILAKAGYRTIAYADHPFFYSGDPQRSLVRGFAQFSVISDFVNYAAVTNVGTPGGRIERRLMLTGMSEMTASDLETQIQRFNAGEIDVELERDGDLDPDHDQYFAKLSDLYGASEYFAKRYRADFDAHVFEPGNARPYFLFLNLHMCTIANPDPGLFQRWWLRTLMLNARRKRAQLIENAPGESVLRTLTRNFRHLELKHEFDRPYTFLKQVYDNRFYDATFAAIWRHLEERGLMRNTVAVVTSDHGMSFGEHGEDLYLHGGARPYEYLSRVPLVLSLPVQSPGAALRGHHDQAVLLTDLFPTLLELALGRGAASRFDGERGQSLLQRIRSGKFEPLLVSESSLRPYRYESRSGLAGYAKAVYADNYKLIYCPLPRPSAKDPPLDRRLEEPPAARKGQPTAEPLALLFDLSRDPMERTDLARDRPEVVARLSGFVRDWECRASASVSAAAPDWDKETIETLRSLGYIR